MTWQLTWRNVKAATLNATLQFLVIYRFDECNEFGKNISFNNIFDKILVKYIVDIMYSITFN